MSEPALKFATFKQISTLNLDFPEFLKKVL